MIEKLNEIIKPAIDEMGFELVSLDFKTDRPKLEGVKANKTLEVLIDHSQRPISFADCRAVSNNVSALLDVKADIRDKYFLEVSSCGVERPLVRLEDYSRFAGQLAKIRLLEAVDERLNFRATIKRIDGDKVVFLLMPPKEQAKNKGQTKAQPTTDKELAIEFANIKSARLVMTDEIFRNMLKKQK